MTVKVKTSHPMYAAEKAYSAPTHPLPKTPGTTRVVARWEQDDIYRKAFDQVCNTEDWKAPVSCWVPWSMANLYMQAIEFMTGVLPTCDGRVVLISGQEVCHLHCVGYRSGPCGG